jgi:oligopeptide/dipeptide ABC transporter ATP-binding protein
MVTGPLFAVEDLRVTFAVRARSVEVLKGVSFDVEAGETVCLVGESGSGKSMTALAVLGLVPSPGAVTGGRICLEGRELSGMSRKALQGVRGAQISMIFQEPMSSLNPVLTVGSQVAEVLCQHEGLTSRQAAARVVDLFRAVGIPAAEERAAAYPHQMSGGMRQRVMIAMAIACRPKLLIADEPTTALDVTVQKQILQLLKEIQKQSRMAILLITHDMGIVSEIGDRVIVMYAGRPVETGAVSDVLGNPRHPYTSALIACAPRVAAQDARRSRLPEIPGMVPPLDRLPRGCAFEPRCPRSVPACRDAPPPYFGSAAKRVACWLEERR